MEVRSRSVSRGRFKSGRSQILVSLRPAEPAGTTCAKKIHARKPRHTATIILCQEDEATQAALSLLCNCYFSGAYFGGRLALNYSEYYYR